MKTCRQILVIYILALSFISAQTLSLDDCIRLATTQNPQVLAAQQELSTMLSQRYQTFTGMLPFAQLTTSYTRLDEAPYTVIDPSMFPFSVPDMEPMRMEMGKAEMERVQLQITEPFAAQILTGYALARTGVKQKETNLEKVELNAALDAQRAYFQFLQAKNFLRIAKISRIQIQAHIDDLQNMFAQGVIHQKDLLSAKVQGSEIELLILQAEHAVELGRGVLAISIGIPPDSAIDVEDSLIFEDYSYPLDSVLSWSEIYSIDVELLNIGLHAASQQVTLAMEGLLPSFAAIFSYEYNKPNRQLENEWYDSWVATGAIQWDIFNWGANISKIKQAKSGKRQMEYIMQGALDGIKLQARASYLSLDQKRRKLEISEYELETASENYRVTNDLFHVGAATNSELLDAQSDLTRAEINHYTYLADFNIAKAEVEYLTGQLNTRLIKILENEE